MSGENYGNLADYLQKTGKKEKGASVEPPPMRAPVGPMAPVPPDAARFGPNSALFGGVKSEQSNEDFDLVVITFDLRCHGRSTRNGGEESLTLDVMANDFNGVLAHCKGSLFPQSDFYVIGHSLGGAIMCAALSENKEAQQRVSGAIMLDIVEGTAKMSLAHMKDFLKKRPNTFPTVKDAETWFLQLGGMRSPSGAARAVPALLKPMEIHGVTVYTWKTDLGKMETVWDSWFDDLDKRFINLPFSKMLCLANAERLDTQLTVAQMQGKFQFELIGNDCGHYVMDDATATLGTKIRHFIHRINSVSQVLKAANQKAAQFHYNNATVPPSRMNN
ncbi:protein phosphatase methylesterase 1 [Angomonas deanei]|nr:protein phosphatase methylesterase 1 [Angomonas deanei]|eukprot:EPY24275.1 protein phosphatase methylesterase 1 [Angomonas deanei]